MNYVQTETVEDDFTSQLDKEIKQARLNEEWRSEYLKTYVNDMDMRREGYLEGEEHGRIAGKAEALTELIKNLMETQHISEEDAKKMLKIQ